ncbi:hypothetical protein D779_0265 [Imhoffiella purpurea]|uniref:Uncharacterized protein n=1 Tax=Imhoffiella purpurea TaxID=1249627 RepID=W9VH61_9GAMM|nr:hypothetical protein D779_0265 [Imhoffiella purpurea]
MAGHWNAPWMLVVGPLDARSSRSPNGWSLSGLSGSKAAYA